MYILHRIRKKALSNAEILQHLEAYSTPPRAQKETTGRTENRKRKVIQKPEVMQQVLVPSKAVENNIVQGGFF